ncbi:MAG: sulfite exporter TauE/SafE family protein [Desulfobacterales bacterium]
MPEIVYLQIISFIGGFVHGLTGFGVMLVALPLMAMFIGIKTAVPLIVLFGMVINLILIYQLSRHFSPRKWLPIVMASLPGIPVGVYIHKSVSQRPLEILVGIVLIITTANTWLRFRPKQALGRFWATVAGFAAGCLAGSIGTSGPPVVIYTSLQPWTKSEIKATLVAFFMLNGLGVLGFFLLNGFFTARTLQLFGWCAAPLVLGVFAGSLFYGRINDEHYRNAILWLLGLLGLLMLFKG